MSATTPLALLAKSTSTPEQPRGPETLRGHTALVFAAARRLLDRCGNQALRAAGLPAGHASRLSRVVQLGAFLHDLGKASDHFQAMIRHERKAPQLIRHEALVVWLCWPGRPLAAWLRAATVGEDEHCMAVVAAAAHHRKFYEHAVAPMDSGAGTTIRLLCSHPDFRALLAFGAEQLSLAAPPVLPDLTIEATRRSDPRAQLESWSEEFDERRLGCQDRRLLSLCKALVLDADVAGSALPRGGAALSWIDDQLGTRAPAKRLEQVVTRRLNGNPLRPFQVQVAASAAPVSLVRAGCGTGKTLAAYQWAATHHAGRQLWVTYPTTGTSTEGFRDYLPDTDLESRLEHGRAALDLELLGLNDGGEGSRERDRLDALRVWGSEVVVATVDTVLGLLQNQRKGLYAWPGLCNSALVFDEVHAYDDRLFGGLLRFLTELPGIPVLLMTASLPASRLAALRERVVRTHGQPLTEIPGPEDLERLPRYQIRNVEDAWPEVRSCLAQGGKVLWVSNTVDRCITLAVPATCARQRVYHSRFKYVDRVRRHAEVIDDFRQEEPALALTTQVAEMSLDLSADLLITDLAPIPALIQRLGRLNRRSTPELPTPPKPCLVLPFSGLPYTNAQLTATRAWLDRLGPRVLSQRDLVVAWQDDGPPPQPPDEHSEWLDGGFGTQPAAVRDASPGITIVLAEDRASIARRQRRAIEVAIPMNPPPGSPGAWRRWETVEYYPVPPAELVAYDPLRGARWMPR